MRMKKLAAVLSAAAMAVSSLAVGAFAEGEATKQLVKGIELLGTQSEAGVTATLTDKTETNEGVTYQVVEVCVKDPTKLKNQPDGGLGDKIYIGLGIEFDGAIKDVDNSNIKCDGYTGKNIEGQTSFQYSAERTEYQNTMKTTTKEGMMFYFNFAPTNNTVEYFNKLCNLSSFFAGYARKYSATINGAKYETNLYFKFVPYTEPVPEGYTDLGSDWKGSVSIDFTNAKEGDKVVIDFNKVNADAQIKIGIGKAVIMAEKEITEKDLTDNKFEYVLTEENIKTIAADTNKEKWGYVGGINAVIKATLEPKAVEAPTVTVDLNAQIEKDKTILVNEKYAGTDDIPVPTVKEGDVIGVTVEKIDADGADPAIQFFTKVGGEWKWTELSAEAAAAVNNVCTYTVKAEDAAKINSNGVICIKGANAKVVGTKTAGDDKPDNNGGNNPGYVVITPNDTTAADTTAAAPEVVTGANGESVEAPKDVVPEGAVLEAKEQTKEEAVKAVEAVKTTDDNKEVVETVKKSVEDGKAAVLDINLVKDGVKVQPDGTIKVTINIPEILKNAAQLFVYRVEDNGTFTDVKATVSGGKLVFSTGHFSTYIITSEALTGNAVVTEATTAAPAETTATTTAGGSTSTEDKNQATGVVLAVIPAMLAAAGVVASKKRK